MRKIAIGLLVGAASLATPASAEIIRRSEAGTEKVETSRMKGGAARAMTKTDKKARPNEGKIREMKFRPEDKVRASEVKIRPGEGKIHGDPHVSEKAAAAKKAR
jgi:hypothetical protein